MLNIKNNKGITLMALVITIIIILILASITVNQGYGLIKEAKIQNLETNLLAIRAKAKEYGENVDAKNWAEEDETEKQNKNEEEFINTYKLNLFDASGKSWDDPEYTYYSLDKESFDNMDLSEIYDDNDEEYIIGYKTSDLSEIEIIYAEGIEYNDKIIYSLTELQNEE